MIELKGLYKSFGSVPALQDIHLFIQEGEIFGIIGKSGAGKSTLLRTLNLLETPDEGEIIIDNQSMIAISSTALRQVRHKIAIIFQQFNLLSSKTVYDNIALPLRIQKVSETEISPRVDELLDLVGLTDRKLAYPAQLSGGQKQRVAIARALSISPKILLCDEATSALDPETTETILSLLKKINQRYGITIVLITHEMDVIKSICHRLGVMEEGRLKEVDALKNVVQNPDSEARRMLFAKLTPQLPAYLSHSLTQKITSRPILRLYFQGASATVPFISQTSRDLQMNINILLANMDRVDDIICGILIVELAASQDLLQAFMQRCHKADLTVEILGYVLDTDV